MKELLVSLGERSYPIYIGEGLLNKVDIYLEKHHISTSSTLMIITDENVAKYHLHPLESILAAKGYQVTKKIVAPGEASKSLQVFEEISTAALQAGLDRNSTIIALGGGVVGDLAGFVAASYMRGIRFVQIPTTILAHDSSVGGKVAVNLPMAKNIIGAFHQPEMVLYDTDTLTTLPMRDIRAGFSEVVKHGFIWDQTFVAWCEENAEKLLLLDTDLLQYALYQGCKLKAYIVSQDEREGGIRAILNLGHTIGHAIEAVAQYNEFLHGEAISIGMVGAGFLAEKLGYSEEIPTTIKRVLQKFGLPILLPHHLDIEQIIDAMMHDKKFKEGKIYFVIPTEIGKVEMNREIPRDLVREVLMELKGVI